MPGWSGLIRHTKSSFHKVIWWNDCGISSKRLMAISTLPASTSLKVTSEGVSTSRMTSGASTRNLFTSSGIRVDSRSEEHTSELQSRPHLVCRLLLEKKKQKK